MLGHIISLSDDDSNGYRDIWIFSGTNAIVYFAASSVGALLCDPLTELFVGRRGAIFVAALFTFTASIGEAFAPSWQALFGCRLYVSLPPLPRIYLADILRQSLLGIGMGAKSSVVPVYGTWMPILLLTEVAL